VGYPDVSNFRLVDMFTACTTPDVKECIIKSFVNPGSRLRIVVSTVAFGVGLDCPNVYRIIHWGPPSDLESYIQETGRDRRSANAIVYFFNKDLSFDYMEHSMKEFVLINWTAGVTL